MNIKCCRTTSLHQLDPASFVEASHPPLEFWLSGLFKVEHSRVPPGLLFLLSSLNTTEADHPHWPRPSGSNPELGLVPLLDHKPGLHCSAGGPTLPIHTFRCSGLVSYHEANLSPPFAPFIIFYKSAAALPLLRDEEECTSGQEG